MKRVFYTSLPLILSLAQLHCGDECECMLVGPLHGFLLLDTLSIICNFDSRGLACDPDNFLLYLGERCLVLLVDMAQTMEEANRLLLVLSNKQKEIIGNGQKREFIR